MFVIIFIRSISIFMIIDLSALIVIFFYRFSITIIWVILGIIMGLGCLYMIPILIKIGCFYLF